MSKKSSNILDSKTSVIIATKNSAKFLQAALDSVLNSGTSSLELIVVDQQSTDGTVEILKNFSSQHSELQFRLLVQKGVGLYNAWNQALCVASGEYLAFLDSDDIWSKDRIKIAQRCLLADPDLYYAVSNFQFFLEQGCSVPTGFNRALFDKPMIGRIPGALYARRAAFEKVGNFDESYSIAGDVDWFARAKDLGLKYLVIEDVLLHKRIHENNLSGFAEKNNKELLKILRESIKRQV